MSSDIGVCLGMSLDPPAIAGVRFKQGALHLQPCGMRNALTARERETGLPDRRKLLSYLFVILAGRFLQTW
jgi:hypothetical protein